jgi:hypothetical protein
VVELIDQPGPLTRHRLEPAGDLAQGEQFGRNVGTWLRSLGQGIAGAGSGLDRVGLLVAVDGDAIVLVALGVAAGDGEGGVVDVEASEPGEEVVGVQAGGIETDVEANAAVVGELGDEVEEALAEAGVPDGGLGHLQVGRGGLQVGGEESDVVAVPGRVDADADVDDGRVGGPLVSGPGAW